MAAPVTPEGQGVGSGQNALKTAFNELKVVDSLWTNHGRINMKAANKWAEANNKNLNVVTPQHVRDIYLLCTQKGLTKDSPANVVTQVVTPENAKELRRQHTAGRRAVATAEAQGHGPAGPTGAPGQNVSSGRMPPPSAQQGQTREQQKAQQGGPGTPVDQPGVPKGGASASRPRGPHAGATAPPQPAPGPGGPGGQPAPGKDAPPVDQGVAGGSERPKMGARQPGPTNTAGGPTGEQAGGGGPQQPQDSPDNIDIVKDSDQTQLEAMRSQQTASALTRTPNPGATAAAAEARGHTTVARILRRQQLEGSRPAVADAADYGNVDPEAGPVNRQLAPIFASPGGAGGARPASPDIAAAQAPPPGPQPGPEGGGGRPSSHFGPGSKRQERAATINQDRKSEGRDPDWGGKISGPLKKEDLAYQMCHPRMCFRLFQKDNYENLMKLMTFSVKDGRMFPNYDGRKECGDPQQAFASNQQILKNYGRTLQLQSLLYDPTKDPNVDPLMICKEYLELHEATRVALKRYMKTTKGDYWQPDGMELGLREFNNQDSDGMSQGFKRARSSASESAAFVDNNKFAPRLKRTKLQMKRVPQKLETYTYKWM